MQPQLVSARRAIDHIQDRQTICVGGAGAGHAIPDKLLEALGERFTGTGQPTQLTVIHPCGVGDNDQRGLNHVAHEGLLKRNIGGFWGNAPKMVALAQAGKVEGYNFPQGVLSHLMRATAGGEAGYLTKTGLGTFVDPRYEGGKVNERTTEDLVEVVTVGGRDQLYYHTHPIDVALIRGSSVDKEGNLTMEHEVGQFAMLSMAQAARTNGGIVIAQVRDVHTDRYAAPGSVKVPGVLIDYVVQDPDQTMTFITDHEDAFISRDALYKSEELSVEGIKEVVSKRAATEIRRGEFVNLGYGMPDGVPIVARQEGIVDDITFLIEQGPIGGVISTGLNFGAMYNPSAILDDGYQFDYFHGGGLDICFLGFAQIDAAGNVNASRFGNIFTGCGGFIDISQNTRRVIFCGGFAAKTRATVSDGELKLANRGKFKKFVAEVEQVTFNGPEAFAKGQQVRYCTERAVFDLTADGIELIEIAPGVDLEEDILAMMEFRPRIADNLRMMDADLFRDVRLGLKDKLVDK